MFQFEPRLESRFTECTPFDESALRQSPEYAEVSRTLRVTRQFLQRHAPESMADIDAFLNTCLELVDLECRHYFSEGYRLGREGAKETLIKSRRTVWQHLFPPDCVEKV